MNKTWMLLLSLVLPLNVLAQSGKISIAPYLQNNEGVISSQYHNTLNLQFQLKEFLTKEISYAQSSEKFVELTHSVLNLTSDIGGPRQPFKAITVIGTPQSIDVNINPGHPVELQQTVLVPYLAEGCRCDEDHVQKFIFNQAKYSQKSRVEKFYDIQYLGKYRGTDVSRIVLYPVQMDYSKRVVTVYPEMSVDISNQEKNVQLTLHDERYQNSNYDLLVVTPSKFVTALTSWINFKNNNGTRVKVITVDGFENNLPELAKIFKSEYDLYHYRYSIIVGADTVIGNYKVPTSGGQTPSDYPFYLMDNNDMIPDVHYARLVATTDADIINQTKKWMDYEKTTFPSTEILRAIGIASNEGYSPSDNEYVKAIETEIKKHQETVFSHFYQNDVNSNATKINEAFNQGASWMTYMGHGSGTSWASTNVEYKVSHVPLINNARNFKPILIDVACQNGILKNGYLGERFSNSVDGSGNPIGTAMYYGGTVNISWHPPAIMARGMIQEMYLQNLTNLGDVILSGHLHLMNNYSSMDAVKDNFEWYHLFGDPSVKVRLQ
jgi:hypothetical protein